VGDWVGGYAVEVQVGGMGTLEVDLDLDGV
jgi:hypothetical protein